MPKVSIIIPVYNVEKYLRKCLDSVINQTLEDIEIICIDDKSTDNSLNILKEYQLKDNRFVILEQKNNQGQGIARNLGIDVATGKYIGFVDPDDWIKLDMYEEMYNYANKLNSDVVFIDSIIYQEESEQEWEYMYRYKAISPTKCELVELPINTNIDKNIIYQTLLASSCHSCNRIFKSDFIKNNQIYFPNTRCFEDCIFILKVYILANNISYIPKAYYYYRQHKDSTLSTRQDGYSDLSFVFDEIKEMLVQYSLETDLADNYRYFCLDNTSFIYKKIRSKKDRQNLIKKIKKYFSNDDYKILKEKLNINLLKNFFQFIFSIKNSQNRAHKVITIFGIKIKIKRSHSA